MFAMMETARLEALHLANDPATGLKAIIAIHNTRLGPALGGCRYLAYPDDESAIRDAIRLAQGMSYKAALAGLDQGGGKAVIIRPAHVNDRASLFEAFGRMIESLNGRYITAVDSGTSSADMDCIAQQTRHVTSTTAAGDPSPHTALGVFAGIRATAHARLGSDDLEGLRVAVQGLGHVGYALAEQLHAVGAELLVSDLDSGRVQLAIEQLGAQPVAADAFLTTPCDILAPGNVGWDLQYLDIMPRLSDQRFGCVQLCRSARGHHDMAAFGRHQRGQFLSQPRANARNDHYLVLKNHVHLQMS